MAAPASGSIWRLGRKQLDCSMPRIIAIANATPDSFFAGSRMGAGAELEQQLGALLETQPDAIDIGGQSTRPGSARVPAAEELARVLPVLVALRSLAPELPVTIDTYWPEVARETLAAGADGINDISAAGGGSALLELVAQTGCGYVLMHMQGTPETMQADPQYADCVGEVRQFFAAQLVRQARCGIAAEQVALDPGIGFGKRLEDNLALIRDARRFADLGRPLLYGISRKSFIGKACQARGIACGADDPAQRLPGTLGATWELLSQGAMLHRVHDPGPVRQLFSLWEALHNPPAAD